MSFPEDMNRSSSERRTSIINPAKHLHRTGGLRGVRPSRQRGPRNDETINTENTAVFHPTGGASETGAYTGIISLEGGGAQKQSTTRER